jgi:hypothetical protein
MLGYEGQTMTASLQALGDISLQDVRGICRFTAHHSLQ